MRLQSSGEDPVLGQLWLTVNVNISCSGLQVLEFKHLQCEQTGDLISERKHYSIVTIDCEKELEECFVPEDVMMSRLFVNHDGLSSVMFSRLI